MEVVEVGWAKNLPMRMIITVLRFVRFFFNLI